MNTLINLKSLIELSAELNRTQNYSDILRLVRLSLMGKLRFMRAETFIYSPETSDYQLLISKSNSPEKHLHLPDIYQVRKLRPNISTEADLVAKGFQFVVPVMDDTKIQAMFLLGGRFGNKNIEQAELEYAELIASICSSALKNAEAKLTLIVEKKETEKRNQLLTTLFDLSKHFSRLFSSDTILPTVSRFLMGQLRVTRFAILLYENERYHLVVNRFDEPIHPDKYEDDFFAINATIEIDKQIEENNFLAELRHVGVKVASPIIISNEKKGLLLIGKQINSSGFSEYEINFIDALSNSAGSALENEKYVLEISRRKALENDMKTALDIQKGLLPKEDLHTSMFAISGVSIPARFAAGDYFDYIKLSDNKYLVIIADVSGKGIPASLIMANLQAALRVLAPHELPLDELVKQLNLLVYQNTASDKFVTAFLGLLDIKTGAFEYVNAGHNAPLLIRKNGKIQELLEGGMILGGFNDADIDYEMGHTELKADDILLLYTDGVNEALNEHRLEYGMDRLERLLLANQDKSTHQLCQYIVKDVRYFTEKAEQYDDITLLIIKRLPNETINNR